MFEKNASKQPEMPPIRRSTVAAPANKGGSLLSNKSTSVQQNPEVKEQTKTNDGIITSSKTTV